ncbi:MAG: helix-turn-helix domain-containing protein [Alphaproteobacteria bacterium]
MNDTGNDTSQSPAPQNTAGGYHTDMPVGEILRRGREHYGQTLEQVEASLRIRAMQLHALEEGRVDQLPGKAYALGFVRSYAEYLGLDGEKMVQLYKAQTLGKIKPDLNFPVAASESKLPALWLAIGLALIGIVIIGLWAFYKGDDRSMVEEIPPVATVLNGDSPQEECSVYGPPAPTPLQLAEMQARAQESAASEPEEAEQGIILNIVENSWVEIRDASGRSIVSRVLKQGEQYFVPDRPDLRMNLGNASGVEILIDGKALPVLGRRGEVKRNISLDSASLKALAQSSD